MDYGKKRSRNFDSLTDNHYSADRPTSAINFEDDDDEITSQEKELSEAISRLNLRSIDQAAEPILTCGELIRDYRDNIDRSWKISEELEGFMLECNEMHDPSEFKETERSESSTSSTERLNKIQNIIDMLASIKLSDQGSIDQEIMSRLKALSVGTVDDKDTKILELIGHQIETMNLKEKIETDKLVQLKNVTFSYELIKNKTENKNIQPQIDQSTIQEHLASVDLIKDEFRSSDRLMNTGKRLRVDEQVTSHKEPSSSCAERSSSAKFYFPSLHVVPFCHVTIQNRIRKKFRSLCRWGKNGFPGNHPAHMHNDNYKKIIESPYLATWKPFGKRYMMLIERKNAVFMLDQGDFVFFVENIQFPCDEDNKVHLKDTLLDGEIVIDHSNDSEQPSYLINDIIVFNSDYVGQKPLDQRQEIIAKAIVDIRDKAIEKGFLNKEEQPFSVRSKIFFDVLDLDTLVSSEFSAKLPYKISGYYFVSKNDAYTPGECKNFLKWAEKFSIEFLLKIVEISTASNMRPSKKIHLFLNKCSNPYAEMAYDCRLRKYDGKIVECILNDGNWMFNRVRDDRPYANSEKLAERSYFAMKHSVEKIKLLSLIKKRKDAE